MWALFRRVFRSHRFKVCHFIVLSILIIVVQNVHVEVLYQRYFLRMNQNNMTSLLTLLIAIAVTMIVVNYILSDADSIMQGVTLGVFSIMYLILVILMTRSFLNEVYLIIFSYIVLASFFGIEVILYFYLLKSIKHKDQIFPPKLCRLRNKFRRNYHTWYFMTIDSEFR